MSTNNSFNLNLERLNRLNEKLNNVRNICFKYLSLDNNRYNKKFKIRIFS